MTNAHQLDRLKQLLAKADDGWVEVVHFSGGPIWIWTDHAIEVTPDQLAYLKLKFPSKFANTGATP